MGRWCVSVVKVCLAPNKGNDMTTNAKEFAELPKVHSTYAAVIKSLIPVRDSSVKPDELPNATYAVDRLVIDQENLSDYRKVCGFINDGRVPATYFAVLSQTLQMTMMAKPDFPFAMLGLIHIYNEVTQHRVIYDSEIVRLTVRLDNLKAHDKGQQFDFITEVFADGVLVWSGVSTYLSRQKTKRDPNAPKPQEAPKATRLTPTMPATPIKVQEDMGRRYAFVSGDFNLIHLHPLSARAFGYPRAIAHGMWSKAHTLSLLPSLPEAFCCRVDFKTPIFLPSEVELLVADNTDTKGGYDFGVYAKDGDKPHLLGSLQFL